MNKIVELENYKKYDIGIKATRLFRMREIGINVPEFICVLEDCEEIDKYLSNVDCNLFSVRSSCNLEDGKDYSFAGQFKTFLNVEKKDVRNKVRECFKYVDSDNVEEYCNKKNIDKSYIKMNVIIQKQIESDYSGVIFTANPQGILNEIVLVIGKGIGTNIVEDKQNVTTYFYNRDDEKYYYSRQGKSPIMEKGHVKKIIESSLKIEKEFGKYQDIEYAIKGNNIYFLQSRNITTLDLSKKRIILDNSNIVESYPGITLPLTQSFAKEVYYKIFKKCLLRLTSNSKEVYKYDEILKNMVASTNGHMYYQINNFYNFLMFLPFNKRIIPVWQEMLGIKEKGITADFNEISKSIRLKVFKNFIKLLFTNRREMDKLGTFIESYLEEATSKVKRASKTENLLELYDKLMSDIIEKWDITLVNDMYAFLFVGAIKNKGYISQVTNLESMKPIIALKNIKTEEDKKEYINLYGDRNLEELKLETKTFRTNPELLDEQIEKYSKVDIKVPDIKKKVGFISKRAIEGIRNREWSRLYRTRIYGLAREIYLKIGKNFVDENRLEGIRDIFYLEIDEIRKQQPSYKDLVKERKIEYENYKKIPDYSRLVFIDHIVNKTLDDIHVLKVENKTKLYGIGTSLGKIEGETVIIKENKNIDTTGKILVTKTTDPGWIFLISNCKGIIAEKGSLLSHTAIIARELNKPAIVGVENATEILKDGQHIKMDADKGEIECIN